MKITQVRSKKTESFYCASNHAVLKTSRFVTDLLGALENYWIEKNPAECMVKQGVSQIQPFLSSSTGAWRDANKNTLHQGSALSLNLGAVTNMHSACFCGFPHMCCCRLCIWQPRGADASLLSCYMELQSRSSFLSLLNLVWQKLGVSMATWGLDKEGRMDNKYPKQGPWADWCC